METTGNDDRESPDAYVSLRERMQQTVWLGSTASVLQWDEETGMPSGGAEFRASQLAYLSGQKHRLATAPEVGEWIAQCEGRVAELDAVARVNLAGWRRDYDKSVRIPSSLAEELAKAQSLGHHAWVEAREKSDFALFEPSLQRMIDLTRRKADLLGWENSRYDALMDLYEPGAKSADIGALFAQVGPALAELVGPAEERARRVPENLLEGEYPQAAQIALNREVAEALGYDFARGRIDAAVHPFCTGLGPGDTRITTRYREDDFMGSLYGVLHETGHALYEQGLNGAEWGMPAGESVSLGIHESQSRLWENHVGRAPEFWEKWMPRVVHYFPHLKHLTPEKMSAAALRVRRGLIRVDADEVTYDAHVVLRFEMERDIIDGRLAVGDIPGAWNERFEKLMGLKVPDDAHGCLQDVHWSFGLIGYFATYTLGNLNAAQLMQRALQDLPGLNSRMALGEYGGLLSWLRDRIHRHGRAMVPAALMESATGEATQPRYHLEHLRRRYLD